MSDFLFSSRREPPGRLAGVLGRYLAPAGVAVREWHGGWGSLAVARAPHEPEPVAEDAAGLTVLVGEPLASGVNGTLPETRAGLHRDLLAGPAQWDDLLDGPFAALAIAPGGGGRVVTDLFAWIPVFRSEPAGGGLVAGTHVDAVAEAADRQDALDPVSATEFVAFFVCTFPHTLYAGVSQLPPAAELPFADGAWGTVRRYWEPRETNDFRSLDAAAEALRDALRADVAAACAGHAEVGLLLSGGEDARAVLGAIPPGPRVHTFTYTAAENREVRAARRAARAFGATHTFLRREPGHDLRHFREVASLIGSHNQFIDVHNFRIHAELGLERLPVVLGGFSSDALLKADNVRSGAQKRVLRGQSAGIGPLRLPQLPGVRADLLAAAAARRTAFRDALCELRPESADEWLYVYPFSMRKYAANFHGSRRLFRSHEPFQGNAAVRTAAAVPQRWKVRRRLFHRAVRPLLGPSWWVPHSRNRIPYFSHSVNAALRPLLGGARDLRDLLKGERAANQESWPIWSELVKRPEAADARRAFPLERSAAGAILEPGAGARVAEWAPLRQLAALQLAFATAPQPTPTPSER